MRGFIGIFGENAHKSEGSLKNNSFAPHTRVLVSEKNLLLAEFGNSRQKIFFADSPDALCAFNGFLAHPPVDGNHENYASTCLEGFNISGTSILQALEGEFSLVFFNRKKKQLILSRGKTGRRYMFACQSGGNYIFSTHLKAVAGMLDGMPAISHVGLAQVMRTKWFLGGTTIFSGIKKILPCHYLLINEGGMTPHRYWHWSFAKLQKSETTLIDDYVSLAEKTFPDFDSSKRYAVFFSGGYDSLFIAGVLAKKGYENVKAMCIDYEIDARFNEAPHARFAATELGLDYLDVKLTHTMLPKLDAAINMLAEPASLNAAITGELLGAKCRALGVDLAFSGIGNDGVAWGDNHFRWGHPMYYSRIFPRPIRNYLKRFFRERFHKTKRYLDRCIWLATADPPETYLNSITMMFPAEIAKLISESDDRLIPYLTRLGNDAENIHPVELLRYFEVFDNLANYNTMIDICAGDKFGVEMHLSLINERLTDFFFRVPLRYANPSPLVLHSRLLFKKAATKLVSPRLFPSGKIARVSPFKIWYDQGFREMAVDKLVENSSNPVFNTKGVMQLVDWLDNHKKNRLPVIEKLYCLYSVQTWLDDFYGWKNE